MASIDDKSFQALKILAESEIRDFSALQDLPEIKPYWKTLEGRGLITTDSVHLMNASVYRFFLTPAGYNLLAEEEHRRNESRVRVKLLGAARDVLKYVLCAVLSAAAWEFIRRYLWLN